MEEVRTLGGQEHTPEATAGGSRVPERSSESIEQRGMMGGLCFVSSLFLCLLPSFPLSLCWRYTAWPAACCGRTFLSPT